MSLFNMDFWKEVKVNDFALACISIISIIFPPAIGLYLLTPEKYESLNFGSLLLICISFGILFIGSSLNSIAHIFDSEYGKKKISFSLLRDIMPITIVNLYQNFVFFLILTIIPLKYFIIPYLPGLEIFTYTCAFILIDNISSLFRKNHFKKNFSTDNNQTNSDDKS